jgi:hypothetical protein
MSFRSHEKVHVNTIQFVSAYDIQELTKVKTALILGKKGILTAKIILEHVPYAVSLGLHEKIFHQVIDKLGENEATTFYANEGKSS